MSDVERVLDALKPLTEDMGHLGGFVVRIQGEGAGRRYDPGTVEVRFYFPERNHGEPERAMGMLQGHGFHVEMERRGASSGLCVVLAVDVSGEPVEEREVSASGKGSEQGTFGG